MRRPQRRQYRCWRDDITVISSSILDSWLHRVNIYSTAAEKKNEQTQSVIHRVHVARSICPFEVRRSEKEKTLLNASAHTHTQCVRLFHGYMLNPHIHYVYLLAPMAHTRPCDGHHFLNKQFRPLFTPNALKCISVEFQIEFWCIFELHRNGQTHVHRSKQIYIRGIWWIYTICGWPMLAYRFQWKMERCDRTSSYSVDFYHLRTDFGLFNWLREFAAVTATTESLLVFIWIAILKTFSV